MTLGACSSKLLRICCEVFYDEYEIKDKNKEEREREKENNNIEFGRIGKAKI